MTTIDAPAKHWLTILRRHVQVADRRSSIPILAHVLIEPGDGEITVTSSDMDRTLATRLPVDQADGQPVTVAADRLLAAIAAAPEQALVRIASAKGIASVAVVHDGGQFSLPTLAADEFPKMADDEREGGQLALDGQQLAACLKRVAPAMSTEATRYYLRGVALQFQDERLLLTATDGHRLHHVPIEVTSWSGELPEVIMPQALVTLLGGMTGDLEVTVTPARMTIVTGATRLVSRLIDGTFPDWRRVVPDPERAGTRVEVGITELLQAAERIAWVMDAEKARLVKVAIGKDGLTLSAAADGVSGTTQLAAEVTGTPIEVGVNVRYLADVLKALPGERASLRLAGAGGPILVVSDEFPDNRMVVMPARV